MRLNDRLEIILKKTTRILIILLISITIIFTLYKVLNIEDKILRYLYPQKYQEYVYKYSEELGVDPMLAYAIVKAESNFDKDVVSSSGAVGLMQLMEKTAEEQAGKLNLKYTRELLYDPELNLQLGLNYFNTLLDYFNQNYILAFAAYNAGLGNVEKWIASGTIKQDGSDIENIPFKETNMYVRKVIKNYEIYKELYLNEK